MGKATSVTVVKLGKIQDIPVLHTFHIQNQLHR